MRLFVAINFDENTKTPLTGVHNRLRALGQGSFSAPENLHLTLSFLGETRPERVAGIKHAMEQTTVLPLSLIFDHVGCFKRDGGDIWWLGLADNPMLVEMQKTLSSHLSAEGFQLERRRFSPHITLARKVILREPPDRRALLGQPFTAPAVAISLMLSAHTGGKLTYTELHQVGCTL